MAQERCSPRGRESEMGRDKEQAILKGPCPSDLLPSSQTAQPPAEDELLNT